MRDYTFSWVGTGLSVCYKIRDWSGTLYELIVANNGIFGDVLMSGLLSNHKFDINVLLIVNALYSSDMALEYLYRCDGLKLDMYLLDVLFDNKFIKSTDDKQLNKLIKRLPIDSICLEWLLTNGYRLQKDNIYLLQQLSTNHQCIDVLQNLGYTNELIMLLNMWICRDMTIDKIQMLINSIHPDDYNEYCRKQFNNNKYLSMLDIFETYDIDTYIDIQLHNCKMNIVYESIGTICNTIKRLGSVIDSTYVKYIAAYLFAYYSDI